MKNIIERFNIMTVTENSVHVTVKMKTYCKATLYAEGEGENFKDVRIEDNNLHRFIIKRLKPGRDYILGLYVDKNFICKKPVRTLPKSEGKILKKFAILADIHYSVKNENRKGRLFIEIPLILNEIVDELNKNKFDFVVCPGDLTNEGLEEEYKGVKDILDKLNMPYYPVVGDHDAKYITGKRLDGTHIYSANNLCKDRKLWNKYFGKKATTCIKKQGISFIKLDTSTLALPKEQQNWLCNELENAKDKVLILSHHQLFPDSYILDENKIIKNHKELRPLLEKYSDKIRAIYVGHKNVASRCYLDTIMQLNCPQISQFPCGYLAVRIYKNGWYHNFVDIKSEYLNESSRIDAHSLKQDIWNWKYRLGRNYKQWNFVY
ncbi:MAG: metallophosphoesterase [bacterium]